MKNKEQLEKQIKESARIRNCLKESFDFEEESYYQRQKIEKYNEFIDGAKSESSKEYWQNGMYTQEQMLSFADYIYEIYSDSEYSVNELFIKWIELNEKAKK